MSEPASGNGAVGARTRVLFTTSNGTGLGHLTRSMAIARRFGREIEPLFLTLSGAAPVVDAMGFPVEYVASYATPGSGNDYRWSRRLRARLRAAIREAEPALIVFDGTHPYEALLGALPPETTAVWCRRALWRQGSSRIPLGRAGAFDAVLEPGEFAESEDRGPTVPLRDRARRVGPIVLLDREELLPRAEAEAGLGLEPGRTNVLVTLGQGAEVDAATARCIEHLRAHEGIQVAALSSAIASSGAEHEDVIHLRATYPMSRYLNAFDACVAAAGYNAYHELIALGPPSLFVPMSRETDDQPARARYADAAGAGLAASGPADPQLERLLDRLLGSGERQRLAGRLDELRPQNGAGEAARWLAGLATRREAPGAETGDGSGKRGSAAAFRRRWGTFVASLPRTAVRLARQQLTQPRPRTLILAFGLGDEAPKAVAAALAETPDPPRRVLVITDSLAFAGLRALGVGFEHVPPPGSRQAELAGVPYERFRRRRLELILAERPKPRRTLTAG